MHRPGKEIDRLTPYNKEELLFDDVPYLEVMQKEHDVFTQMIQHASGAQVIRLREVLLDILRDEKLRYSMLSGALSERGFDFLIEDLFPRLSNAEVVSILVAGARVWELQQKLGKHFKTDLGQSAFAVVPCPNLYFMRDPAAVTQAGVIYSQMKKPGRRREANLLRQVYENHPYFAGQHDIIYRGDLETEGAVEGGDVIVLSERSLAIGNSERTDHSAIAAIAEKMLQSGAIDRLYEVHLPEKRNFMHLDTVFTIIDQNLVLTYPDAVSAVVKTTIYERSGKQIDGKDEVVARDVQKGFLDVLKDEIEHLELIHTADGNPDYSSKEQWFDGANVFAIGPRRVISYNRNKHTNRALKDAGVEVLEIPSSELSRGLGGPRCMTMPIERKSMH